MHSKKYMYDAGQKTCLNLLEDGFVHTFEEVLNLMNMNKVVREEAEHGLDKKMPKDFRTDHGIIQYIADNLKAAEEAIRKDVFEDNYNARMKLGNYFHELEGYYWLAVYFYKSSQASSLGVTADILLNICSLEKQALLEENRENPDIALKYLEKALRMAKKNSVDEKEPISLRLNEHLCRIYRKLGSEYLEKEKDSLPAEKSISLKYFRNATELAMMGNNLENQASCQALLGKALMKFNNDEEALKSFELYIALSKEKDDIHGMCQGHFAVSEVFKRSGDLEKSTESLNICLTLSKENHLDTIFIFASISLGQIKIAKMQYFEADQHFEEAYKTVTTSDKDFANKKTLNKLCKIMYGIGKAHPSFSHLLTTLQSPNNLSLPKLFSWRNTGGRFTGEVIERQDYLIDLEETERDEASEISVIIEKLMKNELNGQD